MQPSVFVCGSVECVAPLHAKWKGATTAKKAKIFTFFIVSLDWDESIERVLT
jgi:hypothetical protein